ncbi:hypothetical protein MKW98_026020 [Papaver atlanticum]|uniref:beta-galactosidase n=1 Tax=Papaver atlanticum TaxID=357466 RepID=A0AAD4RYV7_9MAGN|nr:hypothetical protein MKW98_026020 [Papaver atlanticum]
MKNAELLTLIEDSIISDFEVFERFCKLKESGKISTVAINAFNGFYCDYFTPNKKYKPKMWTENWTGWFTGFGAAVPRRPAGDVASSVAEFIQTGGSFMNYYIFHGGANFGRTAGGPFIATSYDYDAPVDEYGLCLQLPGRRLCCIPCKQ